MPERFKNPFMPYDAPAPENMFDRQGLALISGAILHKEVQAMVTHDLSAVGFLGHVLEGNPYMQNFDATGLAAHLLRGNVSLEPIVDPAAREGFFEACMRSYGISESGIADSVREEIDVSLDISTSNIIAITISCPEETAP